MPTTFSDSPMALGSVLDHQRLRGIVPSTMTSEVSLSDVVRMYVDRTLRGTLLSAGTEPLHALIW